MLHKFYCFLDGCLGYNQIPIVVEDQEITTFTFLFGTFAYKRKPLVYVMHLLLFKYICLALFLIWLKNFGSVYE